MLLIVVGEKNLSISPAADRLSYSKRGFFTGPIISLVCAGLRRGSAPLARTRPARRLNVASQRTTLPCQPSVRRAHGMVLVLSDYLGWVLSDLIYHRNLGFPAGAQPGGGRSGVRSITSIAAPPEVCYLRATGVSSWGWGGVMRGPGHVPFEAAAGFPDEGFEAHNHEKQACAFTRDH